MFELDLTVARGRNGKIKVLFAGEHQMDAAVKAYKEADEEFTRVAIYHLPSPMMERDPVQDAQMLEARNKDSEVFRRTQLNKLRNAAAALQAEAKKSTEEATKLLADAEAAEKALAKAVEPKK